LGVGGGGGVGAADARVVDLGRIGLGDGSRNLSVLDEVVDEETTSACGSAPGSPNRASSSSSSSSGGGRGEGGGEGGVGMQPNKAATSASGAAGSLKLSPGARRLEQSGGGAGRSGFGDGMMSGGMDGSSTRGEAEDVDEDEKASARASALAGAEEEVVEAAAAAWAAAAAAVEAQAKAAQSQELSRAQPHAQAPNAPPEGKPRGVSLDGPGSGDPSGAGSLASEVVTAPSEVMNAASAAAAMEGPPPPPPRGSSPSSVSSSLGRGLSEARRLAAIGVTGAAGSVLGRLSAFAAMANGRSRSRSASPRSNGTGTSTGTSTSGGSEWVSKRGLSLTTATVTTTPLAGFKHPGVSPPGGGGKNATAGGASVDPQQQLKSRLAGAWGVAGGATPLQRREVYLGPVRLPFRVRLPGPCAVRTSHDCIACPFPSASRPCPVPSLPCLSGACNPLLSPHARSLRSSLSLSLSFRCQCFFVYILHTPEYVTPL